MTELSTSLEKEKTVSDEKNIFLAKLRETTGPSHKALEANERSKNLVTDYLTIAEYGNYLTRLYGFIAPCENYVYPLLTNVVPDIEDRKKSYLIKEDLKKLRVTGPLPEISKARLQHLLNVDAAMGCLYVLEGSTLGGNVIFKNVQRKLNINADNGASYFGVYGQSTGKMWKSFLELFTNYAVTTGNAEAIIDGAVKTFEEIGNWMKS